MSDPNRSLCSLRVGNIHRNRNVRAFFRRSEGEFFESNDSFIQSPQQRANRADVLRGDGPDGRGVMVSVAKEPERISTMDTQRFVRCEVHEVPVRGGSKPACR